MRKLVTVIAALLLAFSFSQTGVKKANAATTVPTEVEPNDSPDTANPLTFVQDPQNSSLSTASIQGTVQDATDVDVYKFTLSNPGKVTIKMNPQADPNLLVFLVDSSDNLLDMNSFGLFGTGSSNNSDLFSEGLDKGTYYVAVGNAPGTGSTAIPYTLEVDYTQSNNYEKEVNDDPTTANPISLNTVYNGFSDPYADDYYKFTLTKPGELNVDLSQDAANIFDAELLSSDGSTTLYSASTAKSSSTSLVNKIHAGLRPGTYYLKITGDDANNSFNVPYSFRVDFKIDFTAPAAPKVNTITDQSTAITGTAEANSTISVKVNGKIIKTGNADKNGKFSLSISKLKAGTLVSVTAKDFSGNESKATSVKVKDVTPPSAPSVSSVTHTATYVTGRTEAGAKVLINIGSKTIASGTADSKGNFRVKIAAQRAKTSLYVYSVDGSGNKSKATVVKVK